MSFATILIVEDNEETLGVLKKTLIAHGYSVVEARVGDDALLRFRENRPDLILLGESLAERSAVESCRELRQGSDVPIIVLTGREVEHDKVRALDAGADAYIVRPVGIQELLAQIRAALRRASPLKGLAQFEAGNLIIDFDQRAVFVRGERIHLAPKEFGLLRLLVANLGKPLPRRRLLQVVWGPDYGDEAECLRVVVHQLRKKIEPNPSKPTYICTEPSVGYRFEPYKQTARSSRRHPSNNLNGCGKRRTK